MLIGDDTIVAIIKCSRCGEMIDPGECGKTFSIVTVCEDVDNKFTKKRQYLCHSCSIDLKLFINNIVVQ